MEKRAVIYGRSSTKEQAFTKLNLATQQNICSEYCAREGLTVDRVFVDEGVSAKTADRHEFQRMLAYCREHKGRIHHVLVYKLDRFARNSLDHALTAALLKPLGITLRSATEPIDESVTGMLMENILAAFAQFDNDQRAARTIAGMKAAIEDGRWTFAPPLGYRTSLDETGRRTITPDPERAPLIYRAFELMATGLYSKRQVRDMVTAEGLRTVRGAQVSAQTFQKTLRNP